MAVVWLLLAAISIANGFLIVRQKCYTDHNIGCFNVNSPYTNTASFLPQSPTKMKVEFQLYTRRNPTSQHHLKLDDASTIRSSHMNHGHVRLIIHGYSGSGNKAWVKTMTQELLKKEDSNVIVVNWEIGAHHPLNYFQAAANTRVVGALAAVLIHNIHIEKGTSYGNFHLIGHSLGAHVAGYAGERVNGLGRITGLDPAGPSFEKFTNKVRLDPSDANYVDVIHTNGDSLAELGFGLEIPVGDIDFYPNGGDTQPGCHDTGLVHIFEIFSPGAISCSHHRAIELFTESINNCNFHCTPCATKSSFQTGHCTSCGSGCASMGFPAESGHHHGKFYVTTTSHAPYCRMYYK